MTERYIIEWDARHEHWDVSVTRDAFITRLCTTFDTLDDALAWVRTCHDDPPPRRVPLAR